MVNNAKIRGILRALIVSAVAFGITLTGEAASEKQDDLAVRDRYQAYYNKLTELRLQYGDASYMLGKDETWALGQCFASLTDFDQDGQEELLLAYCTGIVNHSPEYALEVWNYSDGNIRMALSGKCYFNQEIYASVRLYNYEGRYFLEQPILDEEDYALWWEDDAKNVAGGAVMLEYDGEKFVPAHSMIGYLDGTYRLDGTDVEGQVMLESESYGQWLSARENCVFFGLTGGAQDEWVADTYAETKDTMVKLRETLGITEDDTQAVPAWKNAYVEYIQNAGWGYDIAPNDATYCLLNVNDDKIPELLVDFGSTAGGKELCTCAAGQVKSVHGWDFTYVPGEGVASGSRGHMGSFSDVIYVMDESGFSERGNGEYYAEKYDEQARPVFKYYWNDQEVEEAVYHEKRDSLLDPSREISASDGEQMGYMEILAAIAMY